MEIILGSASPRRREILEFFSLPFQQIAANFDEESILFTGDPAKFATNVAKGKGLELLKKYPDKVVLTADTVVYLEGEILTKPRDLNEAKWMIRALSGKKHQVYTGVFVGKNQEQFFEPFQSEVEIHKLTETQIEAYLKSISPFDKAGGYAVQKEGSIIVKRIEGCYYNVMGLPIEGLMLLKKVGIDLWDFLKNVR